VAKFNKLQNNFKSGQLSQLLDGRTDLKEYLNGLKTMRNAFPMRQGGAQKRSGTKFIADVTSNLKDELKGNAIKMIPLTTFDGTKYIFALVADTTEQVNEVYDYSYNMLFKEINDEFVDVTATEYSLYDSIVSGATNDTMKTISYAPYANEIYFARGYNTIVDNELFANPAVLYNYYPTQDLTTADVDFSNNKFIFRGTPFTVNGETEVSNDEITETNHGLKDNERVLYQVTGGAVGGLTGNTYYYIIDKTDDTFKLTSTKGGTPITLTAATSSSTVTFTPTLQHSFADGDEVQLTTSVSLPTNIDPNTSYYVKRIEDDEFELYTDSDLQTLRTFTDAGSGIHTVKHETGKWKFHTLDQFCIDGQNKLTDTIFNRNPATARPYQLENTNVTIDFTLNTTPNPDTLTVSEDYFVTGHKGTYFKLKDTTNETIVRVDKINSTIEAEVTVIAGAVGGLNNTATFKWQEDSWNDVAGYPGAVSVIEGRLVFGGTKTEPGIAFFSKVEDVTLFMVNKLLGDATSNASGLDYFDVVEVTDAKKYGYRDTVDRRIAFLNTGRSLEVGTNKDVKVLVAPDGIGAEANNGALPYFTTESEIGSAVIQPARADQSTLYSQTLQGINNFTLDTEIESRDRYISRQISLLNDEIIKGSIELFFYDTYRRFLYVIIKDEGKYTLKGLYFDSVDDTAAWFEHDFAELVSITDVYSIVGFDESPHNYIITTRKESGAVGFEKKQIYFEKLEGASTRLLESQLEYLDLHTNGNATETNEVSGLDYLYQLKDSNGNDVKVTVIGNIEFDDLKPDRYVVFKNLTVQFDSIDKYYVTLPSDIKEYIVGIQYSAELETMIVDGGLNVEGSSQGQVKRIDEVTLRMWNSTNLEIGDQNGVFPVKFDDDTLYTGDKVVKFDQGPRTDNRVKILSQEPKPMFLTGIIIKGVTYE